MQPLSPINRRRPLLLGFMICASACASLDDFEVTLSDEAIIDGSYMAQVTNPLGFSGNYQGLDLSTSKEFSAQGIDPDDVDAIFIQSIQIVATRPEMARLDSIIKSITFVVQAPNQDPQEIASAELADGVELRTIDCKVLSKLNLKPFATSEKMSISADISLKQTPLFTTTLKTSMTLLVDIDVF
jgi:hypothetical protein